LRNFVGKIYGALLDAETQRVLPLLLEQLTPMELVLRGNAAREDPQTLDNLAKTKAAQLLYAAALQRDPNFVPALIAQSNIWDAINDFDPHSDRERMLQQMDELSLRAVTRDPTNPRAWGSRS
jgi:hypothetical protein